MSYHLQPVFFFPKIIIKKKLKSKIWRIFSPKIRKCSIISLGKNSNFFPNFFLEKNGKFSTLVPFSFAQSSSLSAHTEYLNFPKKEFFFAYQAFRD
jgi:hypothetical protein